MSEVAVSATLTITPVRDAGGGKLTRGRHAAHPGPAGTVRDMPTMKRSSTRRGASFVQAPQNKGGAAVRVSPGKGGVSTGMPGHCTARRHLFDKVARKGSRATQID